MKHCYLFFHAILVFFGFTLYGKNVFTPKCLEELETPHGIITSPDETKFAFYTTKINYDTNEEICRLYIGDSNSEKPNLLDVGYTSFSELHWTADNDVISFVVETNHVSSLIVWNIQTNAHKNIYSFIATPSNIRWSPKGSRLLFTAQTYFGKNLEETVKEDKDKEKRAHFVSYDRTPVSEFSSFRNGKYTHIFSLVTKKVEDDTKYAIDEQSAKDLMKDFETDCPSVFPEDQQQYDISPDDRYVAFNALPNGLTAFKNNQQIFVVNIETLEKEVITAGDVRHSCPVFCPVIDESISQKKPSWRYILYHQTHLPNYETDEEELVLYDRLFDQHVMLSSEYPFGLFSTVWSPHRPDRVFSLCVRRGRTLIVPVLLGIELPATADTSDEEDKRSYNGKECLKDGLLNSFGGKVMDAIPVHSIDQFALLQGDKLIYVRSTHNYPFEVYVYCESKETTHQNGGESGEDARIKQETMKWYYSSDPKYFGPVPECVLCGHTIYPVLMDSSKEIKLTSFCDASLTECATLEPAWDVFWKGARGEWVHGFYVPAAGSASSFSTESIQKMRNMQISPFEASISLYPGSGSYQRAALSPLFLNVHGGPESWTGDEWNPEINPELYSQIGFGVISPNPHGSIGYGYDYACSVHGEWGSLPVEDLMSGVGAILALDQSLDVNRISALGPSYGGYLMNWLNGVGGGIFNCMVCHGGITDCADMYGSSDIPMFFEVEMSGVPWNSAERTTLSAMKQYTKNKENVDKERQADKKLNTYDYFSPGRFGANWKVPTLITHGGCDHRVPTHQGYMAYQILQHFGVPSRFVLFPKENHYILDKWNRLRWHTEVMNWLQMYS
ncbi:putative alanyl dipeptidyl peptidase [Monocercomonoides exilis]|uniref:putative alanyl dipeptidyl peptidase n=1 Tax=Monocercomonoides exilis TaxID=2049356 RepID=UPI00355A493E|nr:putative alanyl dipeptidyl peptidase [Monocercomonoides exilis]|eukprot:MONOS_593.1-p1 / transcript=MONOS_593.1 / gene=MONOS_593 / organism=Monocercomonoides_exilis_PA203 / gene_product=alanyl dipeptidyl peptidase / transcript_product=alanyl dipeptidyl peptidase / location=Mono_scaffold00009:214485-217062(-) / protein_length=841 / sequence_SO=supercontig / SO=protein_coding / is_pseudo=false